MPPYRATIGQQPKRKMNAAQQEEQAQKLYYMSVERKQAAEKQRKSELEKMNTLPGSHKLKRADEEKIVDKLYIQHMQNLERTRAKRQEMLIAANAIPTKKMGEAELLDSIDRMYTQERKRRADVEKNLVAKYQPESATKTLPKSQLQAVNQRLYYDQKDRFPKLRQELWEKHIGSQEKTSKKVSAGEIASLTQRLTTKD
eukprot:TRINITY_DN69262_c0_g1_i1.p1 TRINITY_DN69262_c0_g1~~TRINITY_DN69262_c0_g1_i1.p1  ORF type:complete len:200 (+),score=36.83 TRINITY_DN69262_c0_g1_i1:59-658(+)